MLFHGLISMLSPQSSYEQPKTVKQLIYQGNKKYRELRNLSITIKISTATQFLVPIKGHEVIQQGHGHTSLLVKFSGTFPMYC